MNGFYFVTDSTLSKNGIISDIADAVSAGVQFVQYRKKSLSGKELFEEAHLIKKTFPSIKLIINDRADIAAAVDAYGLHIGDSDIPYEAARKILGPEKIIGVSVSTLEDALYYEKCGADYLGVGPVFSTLTKRDAAPPCGISVLKEICERTNIPAAAIGGINLANAKDVVDTGAEALCVLSAVFFAPDISAEIKKYQELFHDAT